MKAHRIYLGPVEGEALERIMEAVRAECRYDTLTWYALEAAQIPVNDHPRNPGHKWTEIEGDE